MAQYKFDGQGLQASRLFQVREYPAGTEFRVLAKQTAEPNNLGNVTLKSFDGSIEGLMVDPRLGGSEKYADLPNLITNLTIIETDIEKLQDAQDQQIGLFTPTPESALTMTMTPRFDRFTPVRLGFTIVHAEVATPMGIPVLELG